MRKYKLYIETSVWNFYYADDAPEKRDITRDFFEQAESFEIYLAQPVIQEIEAAPAALRDRLYALIARYRPIRLELSAEIESLAAEYLKGALPAAARTDALHIAAATCYELDFVISWNMKHIANVNRQEKVRSINRASGYTKDLSLISPVEVSSHAD